MMGMGRLDAFVQETPHRVGAKASTTAFLHAGSRRRIHVPRLWNLPRALFIRNTPLSNGAAVMVMPCVRAGSRIPRSLNGRSGMR